MYADRAPRLGIKYPPKIKKWGFPIFALPVQPFVRSLLRKRTANGWGREGLPFARAFANGSERQNERPTTKCRNNPQRSFSEGF